MKGPETGLAARHLSKSPRAFRGQAVTQVCVRGAALGYDRAFFDPGPRVAAADLHDDDPLAQRLRGCVLDLLDQRGPGVSICPSEAARKLATEVGGDWQELMRMVRVVAADLARRGEIEVTQSGQRVDIALARGPVRLVRRGQT